MFDTNLDDLDARATLASAARLHEQRARIDVALAEHALHFADLHPDPAPVAGGQVPLPTPGRERGKVYGGEGCPPVAEFAPAEFGAVTGRGKYAAAHYIGQVLALRHRLPKIWEQVRAGHATEWKARQVATACLGLSEEAAAYVDERVAHILDTLTPLRLEHIVRTAKWQADPEAARAEAEEKARERGVWPGRTDDHGTTTLFVRAATGDVRRFNATLAQLGDALEALGDTDSADQRRAKAVGIIADPALTHRLLEVAQHLATTATASDTSPDPAYEDDSPTSTSEPNPEPETKPAPAPMSEPAPAVMSEPRSASASTSEPTFQPAPAPTPEPTSESESESAPAPTSEPAPAPMSKPAPAPAPEPALAPTSESAPASTSESESAPASTSEPAPMSEREPASTSEPTSQPAPAATHEPESAALESVGGVVGDGDGDVDEESYRVWQWEIGGEPDIGAEADRDSPHPSTAGHPLDHLTPGLLMSHPARPADHTPAVGREAGGAGVAEMDDAARRELAGKLAAIKQGAYRDGIGSGSRPARTSLYVHITDQTLLADDGVARVEGFGPALVTRLSELLGHDQIVIQPVIDLNDDTLSVDAYEIPHRIRERIKLKYPVEQFPYGTAETGINTDLDHITPYVKNGPPGQTSTKNLIPLGRLSHRIKTHGGWNVTRLDNDTLEWTTRYGFRLHVTHRGTYLIHDETPDPATIPPEGDRGHRRERTADIDPLDSSPPDADLPQPVQAEPDQQDKGQVDQGQPSKCQPGMGEPGMGEPSRLTAGYWRA